MLGAEGSALQCSGASKGILTVIGPAEPDSTGCQQNRLVRSLAGNQSEASLRPHSNQRGVPCAIQARQNPAPPAC